MRSVSMLRLAASIGLVLLTGGNPSTARAWSDHPLVTHRALEAMPELRQAPPVLAESLEAFVMAEAAGLEVLLQEQEVWAKANLPNYPPRPDALAFKADGEESTARTRFLRALRVNPETKLPLYLELLPGADAGGRPALPWTEVTFFKDPGRVKTTPYVAIQPGEAVPALEVVSTGSDEPDMGLDIRIWEDSGTEFGASYGMGKLPFGNPTLEYSTQAPMHMGFYHEAGIVYSLAGFLKRTYPEIRLHQFLTLSQYAFRTGHDYWGWRFMGWGLHYVQDLCQPYHAMVLPGVSVARMLGINTLSMMGIKKPRDNAVQLVTNRHLALENYQFHRFLNLPLQAPSADGLLDSLTRLGIDGAYGQYNPTYPRQVLTLESSKRARNTDKTLSRWLPKKLISDPKYLFEQTEPDINVLQVVNSGKPEARAAMDALLEQLMGSFGAHSRNYVRAALSR